MNFRFIWAGKTRDRNWKALEDEYLRRLSHFAQTDVAVIRDRSSGESIAAEGRRIIERLDNAWHVVALDPVGRQLTSEGIGAMIETWRERAIRDVAFVIGGPDGIPPEVASRANDRLSLSILTFTHEMARVVLLEQLYRGFTIIKGFPYQR